MKHLRDFLVEGGGVLKTDDGHASQAIDTSTPEKRKQAQDSVHRTLSAIHDHFKQNHQTDIFSDRLVTGRAYSGSTKAFMDKKIGHERFAKSKPAVGDIDVKIDHGHRDIVSQGLRHGQTFGDHTILKVHRKGEVHVLARHNPTGHIHQFDFEPVHNPDHPFSDFARSSSFRDSETHPSIKGMHHKVLLNAVGGETHKFGSRGLVSRTDENDRSTDTHHITRKLFGDKANEADLHSFTGLTQLIKKHIPKERHEEIIQRYAKRGGGEDHPSTKHLRQELGTHLKEEDEVHHHVAGFFGGNDPSTHMGHAQDMKKLYKSTGATKMVWGMSQKATGVFSPEEKTEIIRRQWGGKDIHPTVTKSMGSMAAEAHDAMPAGRKHLHLMVGEDRRGMGEKFIQALHAGKIKEMEGKKFDSVTLHVASGDRTHGFSGTKMRNAAANDDFDTYSKHMGPAFSKAKKRSYFERIKQGLASGALSVKRK
jgi:hypothetical protein